MRTYTKKRKRKLRQAPDVQKTINRRNFISLATFTVLAGGAYEGWRWLYKAPIEAQGGITQGVRKPLRSALNKTELFFRRVFSDNHLVKTYPKSMAARSARVNSDIGMEASKKFDPATWTLNVAKKGGEVLQVTIQEIMALPKTEIIY